MEIIASPELSARDCQAFPTAAWSKVSFSDEREEAECPLFSEIFTRPPRLAAQARLLSIRLKIRHRSDAALAVCSEATYPDPACRVRDQLMGRPLWPILFGRGRSVSLREYSEELCHAHDKMARDHGRDRDYRVAGVPAAGVCQRVPAPITGFGPAAFDESPH
jgi:hypothetical protein